MAPHKIDRQTNQPSKASDNSLAVDDEQTDQTKLKGLDRQTMHGIGEHLYWFESNRINEWNLFKCIWIKGKELTQVPRGARE